MSFSWWTFALQAVNFLVLVWLLRRFLFKPVTAMVARRKEEIARGMAEVAAEKQTALNLQRDLQAQRTGIETERQKTIDEQRAQLAAESKKLIDEARAEAQKIREQAATQIGAERAAASDELFSQTVDSRDKPGREAGSRGGFSFDRASVYDPGPRLFGSSVGAGAGGAGFAARPNPVVVTTAHPLGAPEEAAWREQLGQRIGVTASIEFKSDPRVYRRRRNQIPQRYSPLQLA